MYICMGNQDVKRPRSINRSELSAKRNAASVSRAEITGNKLKRVDRRSTGKVILITVIAALVFCAALAVKFIHDINNPESIFNDSPAGPAAEASTPEPSAQITDEPQVSAAPTPDAEEYLSSQSDPEFMKKRVNILVLGIDESTERQAWGSFRTDTMILVSIDFDTRDIDLISIPRDSYVKIRDHKGEPVLTGEMVSLDGGKTFVEGLKYAKINSAFPTGGGAKKRGFEYAMQTVSHLLGGVPVNYYAGFNMNVVKEVVDAMGGVYYDVDINVEMNGRYLYLGPQHLDGQAVLDYCRMRKGSSDIARIDRQQRMLFAIFEQLKSSGQIANIPSIYTAVQQNIQTNLTFTQISSLALLALKMDASQLHRHTIPGEFLDINRLSYWGVHSGELAKLVKEVFGKNVKPDMDIDYASVLAMDAINRQAIAQELELAQNALNEAQVLMSAYGQVMSEEHKAQLNTAMDQVREAADEADKLMLEYTTPQLQQLIAQLKAAYAFGFQPELPAVTDGGLQTTF